MLWLNCTCHIHIALHVATRAKPSPGDRWGFVWSLVVCLYWSQTGNNQMMTWSAHKGAGTCVSAPELSKCYAVALYLIFWWWCRFLCADSQNAWVEYVYWPHRSYTTWDSHPNISYVALGKLPSTLSPLYNLILNFALVLFLYEITRSIIKSWIGIHVCSEYLQLYTSRVRELCIMIPLATAIIHTVHSLHHSQTRICYSGSYLKHRETIQMTVKDGRYQKIQRLVLVYLFVCFLK